MTSCWALTGAVGLAGALVSLPALAQQRPDVRQEAVPYRTPVDFMQGLIAHHHLTTAVRFEQAAQALLQSVEALCRVQAAGQGAGAARPAKADRRMVAAAPAATSVIDEARARWTASVSAWSALSAVAVGPLVERRSARQVDFQPVRPALVLKAMAQPPASAEGMDTVGAPAKGLPALEWLLWTRPLAPGQPDCAYAVLVAADVAQEARALRAGFAALKDAEALQDEAQAAAAMGEAVNQWVGAVESLRWRELGKPVESAQGGQPAYARPYSGQAPAAWKAQWSAIAAVAAGGDLMAPAGQGVVSLEAYLRGRGLNALADELVLAVRRAGDRMQAIAPSTAGSKADKIDTRRVREAVQALGSLKALVEERIAPALQIHIGFSDADGD